MQKTSYRVMRSFVDISFWLVGQDSKFWDDDDVKGTG